MTNLIKFPVNVVKLILEDKNEIENEVFAAISLNPDVTWAEFTLTDDSVNANGHRIPQSEFSNLIKTGINMPIKMAYEQIEEGHDKSFPIGVITHLKKVKNKIIGLAALWNKERPEDVEFIKERYNSEEPLDLSWEISYETEEEGEDGVINLIGTSLNATTLVGSPAYKGRLGITALASDEEEVNKLEEKLEKLEKKLEEKDELLASTLKEKKELESSLEEAQDKLSKQDEQLQGLLEFKETVEAERAKEEKLASIQEMFEEAGLEKEEDYFEANAEKLLELDESTLEFMIQEAVAFAEKKEEKASEKKGELPRFKSKSDSDFDPKELAKALIEGNK
jgi:hypothetical protein